MNPSEHPQAGEQQGGSAELSSVEPEVAITPARQLPVLPPPGPQADQPVADAAIRALRQFHVVGPQEEPCEEPRWDYLPALLFGFRDQSRIRTAYPLFLYPPALAAPDNLFETFWNFLKSNVAGFASEPDDARILRDNFARLERIVSRGMEGRVAPVLARPLLAEAARELEAELALKGESQQDLRHDLQRFLDNVPPGSRLLGLVEQVPMHLLLQAVRNRLPPRYARFRERVKRLCVQLRAILQVEYQKTSAARGSQALQDALGGVASQFLNTGALSKVMGAPRGSVPMRPRRRERIGEVLEVLEGYLAQEHAPTLTVVRSGEMAAEWLQGEPNTRVFSAADSCQRAMELFDQNATRMARLFWAARVAELEVVDEYEPICHSPILTNLRWADLDAQEMRLLPPIVALVDARSLPDSGMTSLSRLLLSGRPVQVAAMVQSAGTPGGTPGEGPFSGFRLELGYLGVSHREAMVEQSSAARPGHLMESIRRGLDATRASLHVIASGLTFGGRYPRLGAWLHAGAAIESRAHPFFRYEPQAGDSWATRLNFEGNTQPLADWPVYELPCLTHDGQASSLELAFTFADYALLEPIYHGDFQSISEDCPAGDLVSVDAWTRLESEAAARKVPYIWVADADRQLHRLAISRRLALACRDRLGFWRTLQEMAGINNEYAVRAAEKARRETRAQAEAELAQSEAAFQAELERVRRDEAGEALSRLAQALVTGDFGVAQAPVAGAPRASVAAVPAAAGAPPEPGSPPEPSAPVEEEEEEDLSFDEPYIDTPLCTSCNECTALNPQLFLYNANKQAYVGDPGAGSFAQLVLAAEKCPARCIHPGKPLDPSEAGLEELVARAQPFN